MKKLLVPVDFSESAYNALRYAYELALANHSGIILLNCYQIPSGRASVMIDFKDILERDSVNGLQEFQERIQADFGITPVEVSVESYYGFLHEGVDVMIKKYSIDLVVMGTTGASDFVKKIIGSNTSNLLRKIKIPLLVIPETARWKGWGNTIFASDFMNENASFVFNKFNHLVNGMHLNIDVLHVIDKAGSETKFERIESKFIADSERELKFHYVPADNPVDGILTYTDLHAFDLLVMVKRKHGFMESLLNESATRKLTLHFKKPLLLLSE